MVDNGLLGVASVFFQLDPESHQFLVETSSSNPDEWQGMLVDCVYI